MTVLVGSQLVAQVQLENMFKAAVMNTPEVNLPTQVALNFIVICEMIELTLYLPEVIDA